MSALSRLRLTMKDELFARTRSGMKPTPRALAAQAPVAEALALMWALSSDQQFVPASAERQFSLLADLPMEMTALGGIMQALQIAGPGLSLRNTVLDRHDVVAALARLEYDAVIDLCGLNPTRSV